MVARRRARYARYLAPIALAATIAGTYVIVQHGLTAKTATSRHAARGQHGHGKYARAKFYVIQAGDSMTRISSKTGIALTTLEDLNRRTDPNSLQTGQRLRLRR